MKSSELSPRVLYLLGEAFKDAGGPPGVLNSLQAMREDASTVTEALIASKYIRKVDFIGSANVGRIVASLAGKVSHHPDQQHGLDVTSFWLTQGRT